MSIHSRKENKREKERNKNLLTYSKEPLDNSSGLAGKRRFFQTERLACEMATGKDHFKEGSRER